MQRNGYTGLFNFRTLLLGGAIIAVSLILWINPLEQKAHNEIRPPAPAKNTKLLFADFNPSDSTSEPQHSELLQEDISDSRRNAIVRSIEQIEPAVVSITITQLIRTRLFPSIFDDPIFRHFFPEFRREYERKVHGLGSGFIINKDGYILTNEHVIKNAQEIVVTLTNGKQVNGELVGSDSRLDLAVVKIDDDALPYAVLGDSDDLIIGEWAIAIGNPFGFVLDKSKPTVTVGVISAVGRDFESVPGDRVYKDMIQTDASINQGNSGGPLVNSNGEVIGINTFIFTGGQYSQGSIGIGFAIPINKAKKVMEELLRFGHIRDFWTGISIQDIDWLIAQSLDLESTKGAIVSNVDQDSPGEEAGLRVGDIIIEVNGEKMEDAADVKDAFAEGQVGDVYSVSILRRGKKRTIQLELKEPTP